MAKTLKLFHLNEEQATASLKKMMNYSIRSIRMQHHTSHVLEVAEKKLSPISGNFCGAGCYSIRHHKKKTHTHKNNNNET